MADNEANSGHETEQGGRPYCDAVPRHLRRSWGAGGQPLSVEKRASTPPSGPGDAPILTMVIKPGYDPTQLGRRIAGRSATVQLAPQTPQENMPVGILRTTYRVTLQPGHGCEALTRAYREPGVRRAYLGAYPGQYPDC
jgi:hypothetical protein